MRTCARLGTAMAVALLAALVVPAAARAAELDYDVFKSRVEPIFLKKRLGHARCYACHAGSANAFRLEKLPAGASFWSEEQSRRQFDMVSALVSPGDVSASKLLLHPLAPEAGGEAYHSGGRQFADKNDPDWKAIAAWVAGAKK